jgi:hypothetical protein
LTVSILAKADVTETFSSCPLPLVNSHLYASWILPILFTL